MSENIAMLTVRASEMEERVLVKIQALLRRDEVEAYKSALVEYEKERKKRRKEEIVLEVKGSSGLVRRAAEWTPSAVDLSDEDLDFLLGEATPKEIRGFEYVTKNGDGRPVIKRVLRPKEPKGHVAFGYGRYHRYAGYTSHASQHGFLANPRVNREIRPERVEEYAEEMRAGRWRDLLSDPITITLEGDVVNGQHRLAALSNVDWSKVENDPLFLVVFGVQPQEAILADVSKRTGRDQATISTKVLGAVTS